jgi:hypothetical protein
MLIDLKNVSINAKKGITSHSTGQGYRPAG